MERNISDFVLDSNGHCFLCLDKISSSKHDQEAVSSSPFQKYSLQYLSRYLKMDMRKVFSDTEQISPHLLAKVESSRLKVGLCEECVYLNEKFSENYRKLEKAEMELGSCLRLIHAKFLDAIEAGKIANFKKSTNSDAQMKLGSGGELEILEVLRTEAAQKCHNKLRAALPRAKVYKLTRKEIRKEQLKFQAFKTTSEEEQKRQFPSSSFGDSLKSETDASDSKMEVETSDAYLLSDDDNGNCPSDDSNPHDEAMSNDVEDTNHKAEEYNVSKSKGPKNTTFPSLVTNIQRKPTRKIGTPVSSISLETGKHTCGTCPMEFSTKYGFQIHYESVHLKVRFKCVTCGKQFTDRSNFNRHQKSAHVGVRYACQVCQKSFKRTDDVRRHQRTTDCRKKMDLKY